MVLNVSRVNKAALNRTAAESRKRGLWESGGKSDGGRRVDVCVSTGSDEKEEPICLTAADLNHDNTHRNS